MCPREGLSVATYIKGELEMMTLMPPPPETKIGFPLWRYLNQPLFQEATVLNPFQFWYHHRIQFLERCWEQNTVSFLERCWDQNCKSDAEKQPMDSH
jgi:hypothetical protein